MTENTAVNTGNADDVVQFLSAQHEQIRSRLDDVLASTGEERQRCFDDVRELLARHETAEKMIVRPLTRKASPGDEVADARMAEESEAKKVLANLEKMEVDSTEFTTEFTAFRQSVRAHAEAEESLEFPILRETSDPKALEKARSAVQAAERMAPTHPHPSAKTTTMNYVAGPFAAMLDRARDAFSKASS